MSLQEKTFEMRMLNDILIDLTICEIEGWGKNEYIKQLKKSIIDLSKRKTIIYKDDKNLFNNC